MEAVDRRASVLPSHTHTHTFKSIELEHGKKEKNVPSASIGNRIIVRTGGVGLSRGRRWNVGMN